MGEQQASDVFAFANHTSLFAVGQRGRPNNKPVEAALHDALLLQFLILKVEVEQERNKKERVKDPESTPAVTYSNRGFTHTPSPPSLSPAAHDIHGTPRQYVSLNSAALLT